MGYLPSPPAQPIATKIGMGCAVADVINHAKFQLDRFRSFRAPDGRKSLSPIDLRHYPYNSYALPCYTVISVVLSVLAFVFSVLLCMKLRDLSVLFAYKPTCALQTHFNFFPPTTPLLPPSQAAALRSVCHQVDKLTVMFFQHRHGMTAPAPILLTPYTLKREEPSVPPTS